MLSFLFSARRNKTFLFFVFGLMFINVASGQTGSWTTLTHTAPHYNSGVMLLLTNGNVIAKTSSGGSDGTKWDMLTPVNGSYVNGTWTTIAAMARPRLYFSSQVLPDGRVYVCGGEYGTGGNYGEVYNPITNTWVSAGGATYTFPNVISDANSEILPSGKVLQASVDETGTNLNYLWDPVTNTYTAGPNCRRIDNEAVWIKLPDSSVLFLDNYGQTSERYIPRTNTWINDATAPEELYDPWGSEAGAGFVLPDGRVFFIGSLPNTLYYTPSGNTSPGTWAAGPSLPDSQGAADAASAMMVNGKILLTLSPTPDSLNHFPSPTKYYEFDYTTNTFTDIGAPGGGDTTSNACYISNMLDLPDGTVLFANQGDDQYYEYVPGSAPLAAGKPVISAVTRVNCDTFQVTGTLFNGITEGAAYGDDWQESTNYPIVRITSGTNVYYATTYDWNRIGAVMTGSLPDTAIFQLPAGLAAGIYSVTVIANGNPSAPFTINTNLTISPTPVTLCPGDTATLSEIASVAGTWSSANTGIATINSSGRVMGVALGTTNISYTLGTCYSLASVTVNNTLPAISGTPAVCLGSATPLSDAVLGGTWSSSNTSFATVNTSGSVTGLASGTSTISYTGGTGCLATLLVTVNSLPVATVTPTGATTFCAGNSVTLNSNTATGYTYQWQSGGANISGATSSSYVASLTGNYRVVVSNSNNCSDSAAIIPVTATPLPSASVTPLGATTFCAGGNLVLNANTGSGLTYQWLTTGGGTIVGATSASYTATTAGDYEVTVYQSSCANTSAPVILTVATIPTVTPVGGASSICAGQTTPLTNGTPGGTWSSGNLARATINAATGLIAGISAGTDLITYTLTNICGSASSTTTMSVNPVPAITPIAGTFSVCAHNVTTLTDATASGTWSSSNTGIATIAPSGAVTGLLPGTGIISYSVTNTYGCGSRVTAAVTVTPSFAVNITPSGSTSFCTGGNVVLNATSGTGYTYQWQSASGAISGATASDYTASAGGDYSVLVNNTSGCTVTTSGILVTVSTVTAVVPSVTVIAGHGALICSGSGPSVFTAIAANGGSGPTFEWFVNGTPRAVTTGTYTYSPVNGDAVKCVLTSNALCAVTDTASAVIVMTLTPVETPAVTISSFPGYDSLCSGDSVKLMAAATYGGSSPSFLWTKNGVNAASGPDYEYLPHVGDTIRIIMVSDYPCVSTPVAASAEFIIHTVTPTVNELSVTVSQSSIISGSVDTFTAIASGAGSAPSFQWYIDGAPVAGATQYRYVTDSLKQGQVVKCKETGSFACADPLSVLSSGFTVTVLPNAVKQIGYNPGSFTLMPNPNGGVFTIKGSLSSGTDDKVNIVVTNVLGQAVYNKTVWASNGNVNEQISLPNTVAAGTYQVSITSAEQHTVFHIVVEK